MGWPGRPGVITVGLGPSGPPLRLRHPPGLPTPSRPHTSEGGRGQTPAMGSLGLLRGPSHGHGDDHTTAGTIGFLWGPSCHCGHLQPAAGSLILPCRLSPASVDPHLAMGTLALPWGPPPCVEDPHLAMENPLCHGEPHLAMENPTLPWGTLPCHGDHCPAMEAPCLAIGTTTLPWQPLPCHGDPRPVVPLLRASLSSSSLSRARPCPQGHQPGDPDAQGHREGMEPVWHPGSMGKGWGYPRTAPGLGQELRRGCSAIF